MIEGHFIIAYNSFCFPYVKKKSFENVVIYVIVKMRVITKFYILYIHRKNRAFDS